MTAQMDPQKDSESKSAENAERSVGSPTTEELTRRQKAREFFERVLIRLMSGLVYVVITVLCLWAGPFATTVLVAIEAWLCCSEFFRICRLAGRWPNELFGLTAALVFPFAAYLKGVGSLTLALFLFLIACAIWYVLVPRALIGDVAMSVFGPLYTSFSFSAIVLIRRAIPGLTGTVFTCGVLASIWLADAGAYLVGSAIGKHKLSPHISPNKTIEGFVGSIVVCTIIWVVLGWLVLPELTVGYATVCGLCIACIGCIGDLFESRLKRSVNIKDSGDVMPGHGGMLDRSDSLLFAGIIVYFFLLFGGVIA